VRARAIDTMLAVLVAPIAALVACSSCSEPHDHPIEDRPPQRRVIEPPSGIVQAGPPYVIGPDGVGPYKLNQRVASLADRLKGGPGMMRFEIPNILHAGLIRAEDAGLLIGTEPTVSAASTTTFLAVTSPEVAQFEQGVRVGSSLAEVEKLGVAPDDPERAHDPHLVMSAIDHVRFVIENKHVAAIALIDEDNGSPSRAPSPCARPETTRPSTFGICLVSGELVEKDGDELAIRSLDGDKVIARAPAPGLVFAVPLRDPTDGRDELVAIMRGDDTHRRTWAVAAWRREGDKLQRSITLQPVYQITSSRTRWIGSALSDIDLYLQVASKPEGIEIGGLLTTSEEAHVRDVVVISKVLVPRRRRRPPATEIDGGGGPEPDSVERSGGSVPP